MHNINLLAVILAAVAQFIVGAIWYMPVFGTMWGKIHGFDQVDKKAQREMQKEMMPLLGVQFAFTLLTTIVLANLINALPRYSPYMLAIMTWVGFVVPTQVSGVMFGGTNPKWMWTKVAIMASGSLVCFLVAAAILSIF